MSRRVDVPATNVVKSVDPVALDTAIDSAQAQGQTAGGAFAPGIPLTPYDGISGLPRAWNFPTGYNLKSRADRDGRLSFALLKVLTDTYDVANMCINHRIDDVRSLSWAVRPAEWVEDDNTAEVEIARRAMRKPDGINSFRSWVAMYLQDVLRYDAGTLYKRRNNLGQCIGLDVVSGTTIAPVLDYYGRRPAAPAPAFVQYVAGVPWEWLTSDDIIYAPFRPQSDSPYGMAPLEAVLLTANTDMRFQQHWMNWFTEGNIPEGFATAPPEITTPEQLEKWSAYWEAMNTGMKVKNKLKFMPNGTQLSFPTQQKFDPTFPMYLMRKVCAIYHVTPNDLGFTEDVNRATGDTQVDVQFRIGTLPLVRHMEDILTSYLQDDLGLSVVFEFDTGQEKEDRYATAQADELYIKNGVISVDEVRRDVYGLETDQERPTPRYIYTNTQGPIPLRSLLDVAGPIDPRTAAPTTEVPLDTTAFAGTPGVLPHKSPGSPQFARAPIDPDEPENPAAEIPVPGTDVVGAPVAPAVAKALQDITVAGLALAAEDTGRVLMIQRAIVDGDDAAGRWEFPGGHLEAGESPETAAVREWQEETGIRFPDTAQIITSWDNGHYRLCVATVPSESALPLNPSVGRMTNPDDPGGDQIEACAWWEVDDLPNMTALREECKATPWDLLRVVPGNPVDDARIAKDLARWRENTITRLRGGKSPRRFVSDAMDDDLVEAVWKQLQHVTSREQADKIFSLAKTVITPPSGKWNPLDPKGDMAQFGDESASDAQNMLDNQYDTELGVDGYGTAGDQSEAASFDDELTQQELTPSTASGTALAVATAATATAAGSGNGGGGTEYAEGVHDAKAIRSELTEGPTPQQTVDVRLVDFYAPKIKDALGGLVDEATIKDVAKRFHALAALALTADRFDHLALAREMNTGPLKGVLNSLWAEAYAVGGMAAKVSILGPDSAPSEWAKWSPGSLLAPGGSDLGWRAAIAGKDLAFKGIADETLDKMGAAIQSGVKDGLSVDELAAKLNAVIGDPKRADMIAQTESARMLTLASIAQYKADNLTQWDLVTSAGACPTCESIAMDNPHSIDDLDSIPPVHPRCRCSVAPTKDAVKTAPKGTGQASESDQSSDPNMINVGGEQIPIITEDEKRGNAQPVSRDEFAQIALDGKNYLDGLRANATPTTGLLDNLDDIKASTYDEILKSWGGATIDSHTGEALASDANKYAVTVKPAGLESVSVGENPTRGEWNKAMDEAVARFGPALEGQTYHLGVFHDDDLKRVDIDPVVVTDTQKQSEQIGAYAHNIGGAYNFADGNGYWPPYVEGTKLAVAKAKGDDVKTHFRGIGEWYAQNRRLNGNP